MATKIKAFVSALKIEKRRLKQHVVSAAIFCVAYAFYQRSRGMEGALREAFFLTALLMLVLGCWTMVRRLGLFDLTEYSWKRFVQGLMRGRDEAPMPSFTDWLQEPRRLAGPGEPLLCALLFLVLYLVSEFLL